MIIGAHMSIGKGPEQALADALSIQATTMQIFTRNPRGGKAKVLTSEVCERFRAKVKEANFGPWVAHAPYTVNLASQKQDVREFGVQILKEDIQRMCCLGCDRMVVHAGSHTGQGDEKGLELLIESLAEVLKECPQDFRILLEGMSGSGTELGRNFEQLAYVLNVLNTEKLGVCFDTAHLWGAGYDVCAWDELWQEIDRVITVKKIGAIHLNDSIVARGSKKDRHGAIGKGTIGGENLRKIAQFISKANLPMILETPNELAMWKEEIVFLRGE